MSTLLLLLALSCAPAPQSHCVLAHSAVPPSYCVRRNYSPRLDRNNFCVGPETWG